MKSDKKNAFTLSPIPVCLNPKTYIGLAVNETEKSYKSAMQVEMQGMIPK